MSTQRLLAICGIIAPISFATVVITLGFLQPGYDHMAQTMSVLGAEGAPNAIIMNIAGLALTGALLIAFTFGLHRGISEGKGSKIGPALLALGGAAMVMAAIIPCDPGCEYESMRAYVHGAFFVIFFVAMIPGVLALFPRLRRDRLWRGYVPYMVITAVMLVPIFILLVVTRQGGFNALEPWAGLLQRVVIGVPLLWAEVIAIRLLRLS